MTNVLCMHMQASSDDLFSSVGAQPRVVRDPYFGKATPDAFGSGGVLHLADGGDVMEPDDRVVCLPCGKPLHTAGYRAQGVVRAD